MSFNLLQQLASALQGGPQQTVQRPNAAVQSPSHVGQFQQAADPIGLLGFLTHRSQPQLQAQPNHHPANLGVPTANQPQGYATTARPQVGNYNPGYIPLQNSGMGGPGYTNNLQPAMPTYWQNVGQGTNPNMVNPQLNDNQQFWY